MALLETELFLDKVSSNYLSACIIDYTLIVEEFLKNKEVHILAGNNLDLNCRPF